MVFVVIADCLIMQCCILRQGKLNIEEIMQKQLLSSPVMDCWTTLFRLVRCPYDTNATIQKCVSLIKDRRMMTKYKDEIEE